MPLLISDEELQQAGVTADEIRREMACRLYAEHRLSLAQAARWAGLGRLDFEDALIQRRIPVYQVTAAEWEQDTAIWPPQKPAN